MIWNLGPEIWDYLKFGIISTPAGNLPPLFPISPFEAVFCTTLSTFLNLKAKRSDSGHNEPQKWVK